MTPDQLRHTVGRVVRSLRESQGRSRPWLADQCHCSVSHLKNIENGHRLPSRDDLVSIEATLGTGGLLADLVACGENDVRRRTILQSLVMLGAALPGIVPKPRAIDAGQTGAVRSMTAQLRALDNAHGGVHSHHAVAGYLHNVALPALQDGREALRSAVAELMLLAGWTAYDAGEHPSASVYFGQAQRLADGDHALTGEILAAMSHQAAFLGRGGEAVAYADAALASAVRAGMPALAAEAHMSAAHGAAIRGDGAGAAVLLGRAARDLDRADMDGAPGWSGHLSVAYLDARTGHSLLAAGDLPQAVASARGSLDMDEGYDRGRMFNLALLTTALLDAREVDEACQTGYQTLRAAEGISSARADAYLRRIALRLVPYRDRPDAVELMGGISSRLAMLEQDGLESDH